jgi:hypothetical protein
LPLEAFLAADYKATQAQFEAFDVNDPFMHELLRTLEPTLDAFFKALNPGNGEALLEIFATEVLKKLEDVVRQKRFTQYGGFQFTRDLQAFSDFCGRKSKALLQGKFARIRQISHLLTLDSPKDALELVGSETSAWKLDPDETKAILLLRCDFSASEVREL